MKAGTTIVRYGIPRLYVAEGLATGAQFELPEAAANHAANVLRLREGEAIVLFDGTGGEWRASVATVARRMVRVAVEHHDPVERESPVPVTLVQALSSAERMDYTVQKAVELGVAAIETVMAEKSVARLSGERADHRAEHWRRIALSACEQCGRNRIPAIAAPVAFSSWQRQRRSEPLRLLASPGATRSLGEALAAAPGSVVVAVGPEAGFSGREEAAMDAAGFTRIHLGPRILRTETVAPAILAAINALAGDWR